MTKKIKCPYCGISVPANSKTCPFCGADMTKTIENNENSEQNPGVSIKTNKRKIEKFALFIFISCGLFLLNLFGMIFPACGEVNMSIYAFAVNPPADNVISVGTNVAGIFFLFEVIGLLTSIVVLWCFWKQSKELRLFMIFTTFFALINSLVSFLSPIILGSGGVNASTFTMGFGFIITGVLSLGSAATMIVSLVLHKKFLVENPSKL